MQLPYQKAITISVFLVCIITMGLIPIAFAAEPNIKLVDFLKDVVTLDITQYSVIVVSDVVDYPAELGALKRNGIVLTLQSSESVLHVYAYLIEGELFSCSINAETGEPKYPESLPTNSVELARGFLERYQLFTGDSTITSMKNMLNSNNELTIGDTTSGNIKMSVSDLFNPTFSWSITYNEVDYTKLEFSYQEYQQFFTFIDDRNFKEIGNTDINVSMEQAKDIAEQQLENYSWTIINNDGTQTEVPAFKIATIDATLVANCKQNPLTLFPMWTIIFILDKSYPGDVQNLIVNVWAETGEVNSVYPLTTQDWFGNDGSSSSIPETLPFETIIISGIVITLVLILVFLIRRKS